MARKSKYSPELLEQVAHWTRDGATDIELAKRIGIATGTIYEWKKRYPEFAEVLKRNKEVVDYQVEDSLLKRALGFEYTETTKERVGNELVVTKEVTKLVVPDTTAQIFWLKNRKRREWRDRQDIEHSGETEIKVVLTE